LRALLAAALLVMVAVSAAAQTSPCPRLRMGIDYLWGTAVEDRDRPDRGMVINRILRATGEPGDEYHNDDSLTTGSYIAAMVKLYWATGDRAYLEAALRAAEAFDPLRENGPVYWFDDDPELYVDPQKPGARPEPGQVYWGFNGTHWLMPTPEQSAGAVYGLYHAWLATGDARYAEWIRVIADAALPQASLMVALVLAESAYQATGDPRYEAIVEDRLAQLRSQTRPPDWSAVQCVTSHGANYVSMALDYPRLRPIVAEYVRVHAAPLVLGVLYNETTGAVYYKRAYVPGEGLTFYTPQCMRPTEAPGAPEDPAWVVSSFNAILWARAFILAYNETGDKALERASSQILARMTGEVIVEPMPGDSPRIIGSIPPFVFDAVPPANNVYWQSYTRQVSSQAVVSLILAYHAFYAVKGADIASCIEPPEPPSKTDGEDTTPPPEPPAPDRLAAAAAVTLAGWAAYFAFSRRRGGG